MLMYMPKCWIPSVLVVHQSGTSVPSNVGQLECHVCGVFWADGGVPILVENVVEVRPEAFFCVLFATCGSEDSMPLVGIMLGAVHEFFFGLIQGFASK